MKKRLLFQVLSIALILMLCVVLIVVKAGKKDDVATVATPLQTTEPEALEQKKPSVIEETHDISINVISDGLKDMGVLVTSEYYFRDVINYSESLNIFGWKPSITESSFIIGYDGVVTAGIDFKNVVSMVDNESRVITITIPKAYILGTEIDNDSFTKYSEKDGIGTSIDVTEFNAAQAELKKKARENAKEKGLLDNADENARNLVTNFVEGLIQDFDYTVVVKSGS